MEQREGLILRERLSLAYSGTGLLLRITDTLCHESHYYHDAEGRQTMLLHPTGDRHLYHCDGAGRLAVQ